MEQTEESISFIDDALEFTITVLQNINRVNQYENNYQEDTYLVLEDFSHALGEYEVVLPSLVKNNAINKRNITKTELQDFINKKYFWDYTLSGLFYQCWKKDISLLKLSDDSSNIKNFSLKLRSNFVKNIDYIFDNQLKPFGITLYDAKATEEKKFIEDHIFKSPIALVDKFINADEIGAQRNAEEIIVHNHGNSLDKAPEHYFVFYIFLIYEDIFYLGVIFFSVHQEDIFTTLNEYHGLLTRLLQKYIVPKLLKQKFNKEISSEEYQKILIEYDFEYSSKYLLRKVFPLPLVGDDYPDGYTDNMDKLEIVFYEYKYEFWIPQWLSEKESSTGKVQGILIRDYLEPVKNLYDSFREAAYNAIVRSDNQKERAIAHMQKSLYNSLSLTLDKYINESHPQEPPLSLLQCQTTSDFIFFSNLMRQRGNFLIDTNEKGFKNYSHFQYPIIRFFKIIFLLTEVLLDSNDTLRTKNSPHTLMQSVSRFLKSFSEVNDNNTEKNFIDLYQNINDDETAKDILLKLEFNELDRVFINLPKDEDKFFPVFLCFFELFSNINKHAHKLGKTKVLINNEDHGKKYIVISNGDPKGEIKSVDDFYVSSKRNNKKCTLKIISEQILAKFGSKLLIKNSKIPAGFASYILYSDILFTLE